MINVREHKKSREIGRKMGNRDQKRIALKKNLTKISDLLIVTA